MNQEKTVKEWLELLPEPYRSQALKNVPEYVSILKRGNILNALDSFYWGESKQGFDYWEGVFDKLESGEIELNDK